MCSADYALTAIAVLAFALRLIGLDRESLWLDELSTVETYSLPLTQIVTQAAELGQPPLDNWIGAILDRLGVSDSDWWVRFPAALFGAGGVLLLGWIVFRMGGLLAGLAAAALLAVCPLHVAMSQEARPYAICFFFALATLLAFHCAWVRRTRTSWAVFGATTWCFLMTRWTDPHFIQLGIVFFLAVALGKARNDSTAARAVVLKQSKAWAVALGAAYLAYAPFFLMVFLHSRRAVGGGTPDRISRAAGMIAETFQACLWGYSTRTVFKAVEGPPWLLIVGGAIAMVGLVTLIQKAVLHRQLAAALLTATMILYPLSYATVFAYLGNAVPKPQYLLIFAALLFTCIALGLDQVRLQALRLVGPTVLDRRNLRRPTWHVRASVVPAIIFLTLMAAMTRASLEGLSRIDKRDWRAVMSFLAANASSNDAFATIASDTVPPTFYPSIHGRVRYGLGDVKFVGIGLRTRLEDLKPNPWNQSAPTVWLVTYSDRMYLGFDQVAPPQHVPDHTAVYPFNGLFVVKVGGPGLAADRLMDGLKVIYEGAGDKASLAGAALFRGRYLAAQRNLPAAQESFLAALRQCRDAAEASALQKEYLEPLQVAWTLRQERPRSTP